MLQFVVDVLSTTEPTPNVQQTPYGATLGDVYGNHVGLILFNNTVCYLLQSISHKRVQITAHAPLWKFLHKNPKQALEMLKTWLYARAHAITGGLSNICL